MATYASARSRDRRGWCRRRGGRSTGAVDGVLSLLSQFDQFLLFYKVDGNLLECLLGGFYGPYYEQIEVNLR